MITLYSEGKTVAECAEEWDEWVGQVRAAFVQLGEAIQQFADVVTEVATPIIQKFVKWCKQFYRAVFCYWLIWLKVPHRLARWLSEHWPMRWMPPLIYMVRAMQ